MRLIWSLIRTIVREEVHRLVNQTQESFGLRSPILRRDRSGTRVERVLAPSKTDVWRTADNRPVCFHCRTSWTCNALLPRERLSLTTLETADGTSTTLALKKKYADQTLLAVYAKSHERPIPNTSLQIPVAISPIQSSRQAVGARKLKSDLPRSHDVILGWDFFRASQAVIDCGQNELVLEDICRDSTAPDAWNLYATRDYTLKPHSLTRITVSGYQIEET
ncbi:transposon Ty3-I Gag-Pol polyprotein [Trichonephila clavipes]|nr:transposon Ty3-I Gag-Pol polyprotein [Trichonephila clavipes]